MKLSLTWLKKYLDTNATPVEIADKLTSIGLEVEEIINPTEQLKDFIIGEIKTVEKHPNADRILRLEIDFGEGKLRQILSGLAEHFAPEEIVGRQVCAVLNLPPRKIRGLMSHGMVLTAQSGETLRLLTVSAPLPNGGEIA